MSKIIEFVKRNRRRNKQYYTADALEGVDYRVCPVSGARLKAIGNRYITQTLGMSVEQYDSTYPDARRKLTSLDHFRTRNRRRNSHLYDDSMVEGHDYITCPASGERLSMIKASYIENILEMSVEEYDELYPGVRGVCTARVKNIKRGLAKVDEDTGLTKHELSCVKAKETLSAIGKDGLSGYDRKGKKTRRTHMKNVDQYGRNGYSQLASKAILVGNATKVERGIIMAPEHRDAFHRYRLIVTYITNQVRPKLVEGYTTGLCGTEGGWQVDHKLSVSYGYKNKVSPILLGNINNLEMMRWEDNLDKWDNSSISLEELELASGYAPGQSENEYNKLMSIIEDDIKCGALPSGISVLDRYYDSAL